LAVGTIRKSFPAFSEVDAEVEAWSVVGGESSDGSIVLVDVKMGYSGIASRFVEEDPGVADVDVDIDVSRLECRE
jgi:hypothetical protein